MREGNSVVELIHPKTIEQCLIAFGLKELNKEVEVILTVELIADICTRIIRAEDYFVWWDNDEGEEDE
jgi:hypothetical protein